MLSRLGRSDRRQHVHDVNAPLVANGGNDQGKFHRHDVDDHSEREEHVKDDHLGRPDISRTE